jgi:hypothetical protein
MVVARTNVQAPDAIALTQRRLAYAKKEGWISARPQVTVTGHSLGGALAQITSHHFNVKGETFNAYGAVSLSYRIPEGGNTMINHVMASDPVSAASRTSARYASTPSPMRSRRSPQTASAITPCVI